MYLKEYQGKNLFKEYGIPIPHSVTIFFAASLEKAIAQLTTSNVVVKAQTLTGGRGKAGLVKIVPKEKATAAALPFFKKKVGSQLISEVLIEEKVDGKAEWYISISVDGASRGFLLLFSERGGMDVEEVTQKYPKEVKRYHFTVFEKARLATVFPKEHRKRLVALAAGLHRLMKEKDAILAEINPLILTNQGALIAADAKVIIDDNALFRHPEFRKCLEEYSPAEQKARTYGLHYVELPQPKGSIAVIGNGAGLVMASLDLVYYYGGHPASFLDLSGGTGKEAMEKALEITLSKKEVRGVLVNVFAGITRADEIAEAIVHFKNRQKVTLPFAIRMIGAEETRAEKILEEAGLPYTSSMETAIKDIIKKVG